MAAFTFHVHDYLLSHGAVGPANAIPAETVALSLLGHDSKDARRRVRKMAEIERARGAMICASTGRRNGYFLPSSPADVEKQKAKWEDLIVNLAISLRPFRAMVKIMNAGEVGRLAPGHFPTKLTRGPDGKTYSLPAESECLPAERPGSTESGSSDARQTEPPAPPEPPEEINLGRIDALISKPLGGS